MANTEVPAGDQAPNPTDSAAKSGSGGKGTKASKCERIWVGILIAVVVILAIAGIVTTSVLEHRKRVRTQNRNKYEDDWHHHDDHYYHDDYYHDDYYNDDAWSEPIETAPFEVDVSQFSSEAASPYTSVDEVRAVIEAFGKAMANKVILNEANVHAGGGQYYDDIFGPPMASIAESDGGFVSKDQESFRGKDDFETYQHEAGAVKDDMVKSNGEVVFVAVDSRIEVLDLEGNLFEATEVVSERNYNVYINAMLLNPEGTKLTVIASDHGAGYRSDDIIEDRENTVIFVYDIQGSSLTLVSRTHVDGNHVASYSVGNNIHIVTQTHLRTWIFSDRLSRWNLGMKGKEGNEDYVERATTEAEENVLPKFVEQLLDYVTDGDDVLLSPIVGNPKDFESLTQVYSFDASSIVSKGGLLDNVSTSATLGRGYGRNVYATGEWIWVSDEIHNWGWGRVSSNLTSETTLIGYRLDGATTNFAATTTIPGTLLSQFSIDFVEDNGKEYVRVATTQNFNNFWFDPMPMPEPMPVEEVFADDVESEEAIVAEPLKRKLEQFEPRPFMPPPPPDSTESRTLNEVIIFEVPSAEDDTFLLTRLGSLEVGKINEIITAVRFFDKLSYVVTFERTDPFYVLDLSDPINPTVLGELEIPGFSEFMHPINEDNSMLLTVGQDTNDRGWVTGFQISIFDSSDPTDPQLLARHIIEGGSSSASYDERAFRYIQGDQVGRLMIPLTHYDHDRFGNTVNQFEGFAVFGIDLTQTEEIITRELDINHYLNRRDQYDKNGCWCGYTWLPERSLVFDGKLMTMKNQLVVNTDLDSGETLWNVTFVPDTTNCCGW